MIKIPGTDRGPAGDRAGDLRGHQRQRHAAVQRRGLRERGRGLHQGLERRQAAGERLDVHSVASFFVSRVDTEVDKRLEALGRRTCRARPPSPTPAPPTSASRRSSTASASPSCDAAGAPVQRPLWASTGVKNPPTRTRSTSTGSSAPDTVNTMPMKTLLACAERLEVERRHRRQDPTRALAGAGRGRHRHDRRHRQAPARGHRRVRDADGEAARRHRGQARGARHEPAATIDAALPERARRSRPARLDAARDESRGRAASGARTRRCGAAPGTRGRRPARLAGHRRRASSSDVDDLESRSRRGAPGEGFTDAVAARAWAARRWRPRCSAAPARRQTGACAARAGLHRPGRGAAVAERRSTWSTTLFIVSTKSGGTIETLSLFEHFQGRGRQRLAVRRDHRPGRRRWRTLAASAASGARSSTTPTSAGATARCRYFGLVPAALMGVDVRGAARAARRRPRRRCRYPTQDNTGLWLGVRARRARAGGSRQAHLRRRRPRSRASACGSSSSSPSPRASTARASCRWPTSRSARRTPTATTASSLYLRDDDAARRDARGSGRRRSRDAGQPT